MGEFPLVFFTVLSQLAAGAAVTLVLLDYFTDKIEFSSGKKATLTILIVTGLSMGISLLHLGTPLNAYRALTHLGSSWLSREVALFSLLAAMLLLYYFQWKDNNPLRKQIGLGIAVIAIVGVLSSGMVYVLPAVPAWNNFSTILFFLLTSVVLGPLFLLAFLKTKDDTGFSGLVKLSGMALVASFLCFLVYVSALLSGSGESALTGANMAGDAFFLLRVLLNWILPLGLFVWIMAKKKVIEYKFVISLFALVLIGELIGRYLFYYSAVALKVAGL